MPELPEVECLTLAVKKILLGSAITEATFHRTDLRWPIPIQNFERHIVGQTVTAVSRRSKYMLIETASGCGIFHLGMSGNMFASDSAVSDRPHTHASFKIASLTPRAADGQGDRLSATSPSYSYLHFVDPRRFGCILSCSPLEKASHPLLEKLGPEPLELDELAAHLESRARGRAISIKTFIMDAHNVVGVGNIYASESLFRAGVKPTRLCSRLKPVEWQGLAASIKTVLTEAIAAGGTSFRDYRHTDGETGSFVQSLMVYGREKELCFQCQKPIKHKKIQGRATYFCSQCQV